MECPCKTIFRCFPALSLSRSELAVLVNYEQTLKEVEDGVGTIDSAVQSRIESLRVRTYLDYELLFSCAAVSAAAAASSERNCDHSYSYEKDE